MNPVSLNKGCFLGAVVALIGGLIISLLVASVVIFAPMYDLQGVGTEVVNPPQNWWEAITNWFQSLLTTASNWFGNHEVEEYADYDNFYTFTADKVSGLVNYYNTYRPEPDESTYPRGNYSPPRNTPPNPPLEIDLAYLTGSYYMLYMYLYYDDEVGLSNHLQFIANEEKLSISAKHMLVAIKVDHYRRKVGLIWEYCDSPEYIYWDEPIFSYVKQELKYSPIACEGFEYVNTTTSRYEYSKYKYNQYLYKDFVPKQLKSTFSDPECPSQEMRIARIDENWDIRQYYVAAEEVKTARLDWNEPFIDYEPIECDPNSETIERPPDITEHPEYNPEDGPVYTPNGSQGRFYPDGYDCSGLPQDVIDAFDSPIKGKNVSQTVGFGDYDYQRKYDKNGHYANDLTTTGSREIISIGDGVVLSSNGNNCATGKSKKASYVEIQHIVNGKTYISRYYHLACNAQTGSAYIPAPGTVVKKGDVIGIMGMTGYSTGVHLHFELHQVKDGKRIAFDPYPVISKDKTMRFPYGAFKPGWCRPLIFKSDQLAYGGEAFSDAYMLISIDRVMNLPYQTFRLGENYS